MPTDHEITETQAKEIAQGCLTEILGLVAAYIQSLTVNIYFQEGEDAENGNSRIWYLNYYGRGSNDLLYNV